MRQFFQAIYRILLKAIGAIGLLICAIYLMVTVPGGAETRNLLHPTPVIAMGALVMASLALACFQHRLPACLVMPSKGWHAAVIFPTVLIVGLLSAVAVMIALTGMGLPEDLQRSLSVGTGSLFFCSYFATGLVGDGALEIMLLP